MAKPPGSSVAGNFELAASGYFEPVESADEAPCPPHCCCCGPGEACCDCGEVMPNLGHSVSTGTRRD